MTQKKSKNLLSQAVSVDELSDPYIRLNIYGANRIGKTTLACRFPKPLLLLGFELNETGGAISVKRMKGVIKFRRMQTVEDTLQIAEELQDDAFYRTCVLDTATGLQDIVLTEILGLKKPLELLKFGRVSTDQYRERSEKVRECLRPFLNLPKHVIVLAKEKDHNPLKSDRDPGIVREMYTGSFFASELGGATVGWLHDACNIARLYIEEETQTKKIKVGKNTREIEVPTGIRVRKLRVGYHQNYAAGFRLPLGTKSPDVIVSPTFEKIRNLLEGGE